MSYRLIMKILIFTVRKSSGDPNEMTWSDGGIPSEEGKTAETHHKHWLTFCPGPYGICPEPLGMSLKSQSSGRN